MVKQKVRASGIFQITTCDDSIPFALSYFEEMILGEGKKKVSAMQYKVNTAFLNMRKAPHLGRNIITALPKGQMVVVHKKSADRLWWEVSTHFNGVQLMGFVAARYLLEAMQYQPSDRLGEVVAVHRQENNPRATRNSRAVGWSYPIGEAGRPSRTGTNPTAKARDLSKIVSWLMVETSERYRRQGKSTYCNIYAHDYCYLAGAYLPRVWWSPKALMKLAEGRQVVPEYGLGIFEMNANSLYDWLVDFGGQFNWKREFSTEKLQEYANEGKVCIISAKNKNLNRSGHICAVVPETNEHQALLRPSGLSPLISQAGLTNYRYKSGYDWWQLGSFSHFGFWVHD